MSDLNLEKEKSSQSNEIEENYEDDYNYDNYDENELNNNIISDEINTFLEENEIIKERENAINEAMEKLFLERDEAILALIYLEWNLDKLEFWYENPDENKIKAGIELSEKTKKKIKRKWSRIKW